MATWGLHIRIAEELIKRDSSLDETSFLVGNIGPDCGMPNKDWSQFDPPTEVSHWREKGKNNINAELFFDTYLNRKIEDNKERSFLMGYYVHLLTDIEFITLIHYKKKNNKNYEPLNRDEKFIWTVKKDWYGLDHLYFRDNPESIFHTVFQHIENFPDYLSYYPPGAIIRQIKYITRFYQNPPEGLDREYIYLSVEEMDGFVSSALKKIEEKMNRKLN